MDLGVIDMEIFIPPSSPSSWRFLPVNTVCPGNSCLAILTQRENVTLSSALSGSVIQVPRVLARFRLDKHSNNAIFILATKAHLVVVNHNVIMVVKQSLSTVIEITKGETRVVELGLGNTVVIPLRSRQPIHKPVDVVTLGNSSIGKFSAAGVEFGLCTDRFAGLVLCHVKLEWGGADPVTKQNAP